MMAFLEPAKDPDLIIRSISSGRMGFINAVDHFESIRSVLLANVSARREGVIGTSREREPMASQPGTPKGDGRGCSGSGSLRRKEVHGPVRGIAQTV
jgi:hypothetical protein